MTTSRRRALPAAALTLGLLLAGCGGGSSDQPERSPEEVLAASKTALDETSGVHVVLSTEKLPPGVSGILHADGIGTHAPAFEGTLKVTASGITADAEVVAVGGEVHAKLPFTTDFSPIDPADYGAPDPSDLMRPEGGLSSLLTSTEDVEEGDAERSGDTVLNSYTGTVPGEVVTGIIPTASAESDFRVKYAVTEDDVLREAVLTGPFYPDSGAVTYTITFDQYGTEKEITAP